MEKIITNKQIIKKLRKSLEGANRHRDGWDRPPYFNFNEEDLAGRTITEFRKIKNPLRYNRRFESPNPEYLDVFLFDDNSYLAHMNIGWNDGTTLHSFLVEGRKIRYSDRLYRGIK